MTIRFILASSSNTRITILKNAGLPFDAYPARIDEELIREALLAQSVKARDVADVLAEAKAKRLSIKYPDQFVLGCDQVAEIDGHLLTKVKTKESLVDQLELLSGQKHRLFSAMVLYQHTRPIWRHVDIAELQMKRLSKDFLADYVDRNWETIRHCVGGYQIEGEGIKLFNAIKGDYFTILGLPMIPLLDIFERLGVVKL